MPTPDQWKSLLRGHDLSDAETEEFVRELRAFLNQVLDDYFRDEGLPEGV